MSETRNDSTVRSLRIRNTVTFEWESELESDAFGDENLSDEAMRLKLETQLVNEPLDHIAQATSVEVTASVEIAS